MRPISLSIESFGSYSKKVEINFTQINEPIFLITGDTGTGKSTIFDAMVFALYGKSSSVSGKEGTDFKSQYSENKPIVTFKFQKNNKEYTVTRSFKETKKTKNGVKFSGTSALLSLTLPDNSEFLGKVADIEKKIEEIIGLTKDQFMQIAMIAQGEFMTLLRAKSDAKKAIFRKLFHTEKFAKIIEIIKEKRRTLNTDVEKTESLCKKDVGRIKIIDNEELLNLQNELVSAKKINITDLENFLEKLEENLKNDETTKNTLIEEFNTIKKDIDILKENLTKNEELKKDFDLLKSEELKLAKLLKKAPSIRDNQKLADKIIKSYELKDKFENFVSADKKVTLLEENLSIAEKNLPVLKKELEESENKLKNAETIIKDELPKILDTIEKAKRTVQIFNELENLEKEIKITKKTLNDVETQKEKIKIESEKLKQEAEEKTKLLEGVKNLEGRREKIKNEEKEFQNFVNSATELKEYEEIIKTTKSKLKSLQKDYLQKKVALEKIEFEYKTKENLFFDSQAGILAKNLQENTPCPVCGSLSHPSPAKFIGKEIKKEELDILKEKSDIARNNRESSAKEYEKYNAILSEKEKIYNEKREEIKKIVLSKNIKTEEDLTIECLRKIYTDLNKELAAKKEALKNDECLENNLKNFILENEKKKTELEKEKEILDKKHIELAQKNSALIERYNTLKNDKTFNSNEEAVNALTLAEKKRNDMEITLKKDRQKRDEIKSKSEKCETLKEEYKLNLPKEKKEAERLHLLYKNLGKKHELSEEVWQKIIHDHQKSEAEVLIEKAKLFESEKSKSEGSVATLKTKVKDKDYPNLESIKNSLAEREKNLAEKEEKLNALRETFSNNKDAFSSLKKETSSREKILSAYQVYDKLLNKLSSSTDGGYLDIETFAQRYYLSEILFCANKRLAEMTGGEYEMRLVDLNVANELKNHGGLDFMIHSYATGKDREIRTLSGGESFLTALALSLGMADRIEKRATAISPDILFIDEGFGSLDSSSRHDAVKVLKSVAGKNRLIAIISHVAELRQEVETKLLVKKGQDGSFVQWEN